jgi:hypothetical protein
LGHCELLRALGEAAGGGPAVGDPDDDDDGDDDDDDDDDDGGGDEGGDDVESGGGGIGGGADAVLAAAEDDAEALFEVLAVAMNQWRSGEPQLLTLLADQDKGLVAQCEAEWGDYDSGSDADFAEADEVGGAVYGATARAAVAAPAAARASSAPLLLWALHIMRQVEHLSWPQWKPEAKEEAREAGAAVLDWKASLTACRNDPALHRRVLRTVVDDVHGLLQVLEVSLGGAGEAGEGGGGGLHDEAAAAAEAVRDAAWTVRARPLERAALNLHRVAAHAAWRRREDEAQAHQRELAAEAALERAAQEAKTRQLEVEREALAKLEVQLMLETASGGGAILSAPILSKAQTEQQAAAQRSTDNTARLVAFYMEHAPFLVGTEKREHDNVQAPLRQWAGREEELFQSVADKYKATVPPHAGSTFVVVPFGARRAGGGGDGSEAHAHAPTHIKVRAAVLWCTLSDARFAKPPLRPTR